MATAKASTTTATENLLFDQVEGQKEKFPPIL
jgi:hypothetical protein